MTKDDILKAIESIKQVAHDDESAHGKEDMLRKLFIEYIALFP